MSEVPNAGHEHRKLPLDQLFLDPNNYRFIDETNYVRVAEDKIADPDVQRRTTGFILGERQANVRDLIDSFVKNGWLHVDQIQVRKMGPNRYLVVEGNRRVATLKHLERKHADQSIDLGALDRQIFHAVPVNLYKEADLVHHMILMGLKHISGNKKWPALNQARMLRDLHEEHGQSADDIVKALGISKREFNLSQNTLALCELYQRSDYGDQFRSDQYNLFREVAKSPDLREWLAWDYYGKHTAGNQKNADRLFSWISRIEEGGDEGNDDAGPQVTLEPAITTGGHVRELADIIGDEVALKNLDQTRSLTEATFSSGKVIKDRVKEALERLEIGSRTLLSLSHHADDKVLGRVDELIRTLQGLQFAKGRAPRVVAGMREPEPFDTVRRGHFSEIEIERYRGILNLYMKNLRRVNIVAGLNNAGKTSVLEAAYLLSQQNEVDALFEVMRRRARLEEFSPRWAYEQSPHDARIRGEFDGIGTSLQITCEKEDESQLEDTTGYLGSIVIEASFSDHMQSSHTHLFHREQGRTTRRTGQRVLCTAILSSPFSQHDPTVLSRLYERSVEDKTKEQVLAFLRRMVDEGIENIELASEFRRFLVIHRDLDRALDLSCFGEGMQRIFHVGLLFSWARGGLVLIDELENAIHAGLLMDFTGFLVRLAREFNVQVFTTTHSKECIDSFVYGNEHLEDIGYYSLKREKTGTRCEQVTAEQLARMLEFAEADIRRLL